MRRKRREAALKLQLTVHPGLYPVLVGELGRIPPGRQRATRMLSLATTGALFEQHRPTPTPPSGPDAATSPQVTEPAGGSVLNLTDEQLADLGSWGGQ